VEKIPEYANDVRELAEKKSREYFMRPEYAPNKPKRIRPQSFTVILPSTAVLWQPMSTAPRNATDIRVKLKSGMVYERAHWASDLSGEEQPPFEGWFVERGDKSGFESIPEPVAWMPVRKA
jgi:hypothetical protein